MEYTMEQLRAAYALNLCTVSVSQIIDYADVNIMEQEYEAILNNLNLEQMPKDEALLDILRQIMDTITLFRISKEDRNIIEQEYRQKMQNGIWEAVPNLALIISGASPLTMSLSLASQIGIGYMNYRKSRAENELDLERKKMKLENDALERFNGLRRQLFTTAWRLSETYGFSDELRLSEKQIRRYNRILTDTDPIRRFERLDMIKDQFTAYPPFWYYYGNTANEIVSSGYQITAQQRLRTRNTARQAFEKFREINDAGLLRDDCIASANALELAELLDPGKEDLLIADLCEEAVRFCGNEKDVLQLAAMTYLNIGRQEKAAGILRQLVNEQYNTVINAQLLSGVYVHQYRKNRSSDIRNQYHLLAMRTGGNLLYPLCEEDDKEQEERFINEQRKILVRKYRIVYEELAERYEQKYRHILPLPDSNPEDLSLTYSQRKEMILRVFADKGKAEKYLSALREEGIPFRIIDLLNQLYESCCRISFLEDNAQEKLFLDLRNALYAHRELFAGMQTKLNKGTFEAEDMKAVLDTELSEFTSDLYKDLAKELIRYISTREEMLDFSIAEMNLLEFCQTEGLQDPGIRLAENGAAQVSSGVKIRRLEYDMLGNEAMDAAGQMANSSEMLEMIREELPKMINPEGHTRLYLRDDVKLDRYFSKVYKLRKDPLLRSRTLCVLDGTVSTISDLIFTTHGVFIARGQIVRRLISYKDIELASGLRKELIADGIYVNDDIDLDALFELISKLKEKEEQLPETSVSVFGNMWNL